MRKKIIVVGLFLLLPVMASAQLKSQATGLDMRTVLRFGMNPIALISSPLLNSDRFHMSQSYSFVIGSFGGSAYTQAVYLNTMSYRISDPLTLSVQWGIMMNRPLGDPKLGTSPNLFFRNGLFFSGAQLKYTPSANTQLFLEVRRVPYNYYLYAPDWHQW
jgi:hypothetical protein